MHFCRQWTVVLQTARVQRGVTAKGMKAAQTHQAFRLRPMTSLLAMMTTTMTGLPSPIRMEANYRMKALTWMMQRCNIS